MDFLFFQRLFWTAGVGAEAALIGLLCQQRLTRRYPFFLAYLSVQLAASILLLNVEYNSRAYLEGWRWHAAAMIVLRLGVAFEAFRRICEHFPCSTRFRLGLGGSIIGLTGLFSWLAFLPVSPEESYPQGPIVSIGRCETAALALAFTVVWWLFRKFLGANPPMPSNVVTHWKLLTVYFGIDAIGSADLLLPGSFTVRIAENIGVLAAETACIVAWVLLFSRAGETIPVRPRKYTDEQIAEILRRDAELHQFVTELPGEISDRLKRH